MKHQNLVPLTQSFKTIFLQEKLENGREIATIQRFIAGRIFIPRKLHLHTETINSSFANLAILSLLTDLPKPKGSLLIRECKCHPVWRCS